MRTLQSFVPKDQDEKLAIIDDANFFFANTLNPTVDAAPTPAETLAAITKTAGELQPPRAIKRPRPPRRRAGSQAR